VNGSEAHLPGPPESDRKRDGNDENRKREEENQNKKQVQVRDPPTITSANIARVNQEVSTSSAHVTRVNQKLSASSAHVARVSLELSAGSADTRSGPTGVGRKAKERSGRTARRPRRRQTQRKKTRQRTRKQKLVPPFPQHISNDRGTASESLIPQFPTLAMKSSPSFDTAHPEPNRSLSQESL
jgi:hypothetical protein